MAKLQPVRGTQDIWGDDALRFNKVVDIFRGVSERYGFEPISTPIFEFTHVFSRTLGETSDVVSKEMYCFEDRGGESLTLRPENTAGIARAYMSEGMKQYGTKKFYAHGPMFRYERPQKGRYRQFNQLDAEIIGAPEPQADVELIAMAWQMLKDLGISENTVLHLNSLGDQTSREAYRAALVEYFTVHIDQLSEDSRTRLEKNPLRILDSKAECDRALLPDAPKLSSFLNEESSAFFNRVKAGLEAMGIPYDLDENLVRGLDYYCHTSFEFITTDLGSQGTVIGGGRYDGLMEQMGGPATPGIGWAAGIERLAMLLAEAPSQPNPVVIIPMGEKAEIVGSNIAYQLRDAGVYVDMGFRGNMKKRMKRASDAGATHTIIIGDNELEKGVVLIRDMETGDQQEVKFHWNHADFLKILGSKNDYSFVDILKFFKKLMDEEAKFKKDTKEIEI